MCETTTKRKGQTVRAAHGPATVCSAQRVECHGADAFESKNLSGTAYVPANWEGDTLPTSAREKKESVMLAYFSSIGMARRRSGGRNVRDKVTGERVAGGFHWELKCATTGEWLRKATQGEEDRSDRAVWSHIVPAVAGGAWCPCNIVPETGALNAARGSAPMHVTPTVADSLGAWRDYFTANVARPATLKRL